MLIAKSKTLRFLELTMEVDSEIQKEVALLDYLKSREYSGNDKIVIDTLILDSNLNNQPVTKALEIREYIQDNIEIFTEFLDKSLRDYSDLDEENLLTYERIFRKISFSFREKIELYRKNLD